MTARRLVSNATIQNLKISGSISPREKPFFAFHLFSTVFSRKQSLVNSITQLNRSTLTMISCVVRSAPACTLCYRWSLAPPLPSHLAALPASNYHILYILYRNFYPPDLLRLQIAGSFPQLSQSFTTIT